MTDVWGKTKQTRIKKPNIHKTENTVAMAETQQLSSIGACKPQGRALLSAVGKWHTCLKNDST